MLYIFYEDFFVEIVLFDFSDFEAYLILADSRRRMNQKKSRRKLKTQKPSQRKKKLTKTQKLKLS